MNTVEQLDLATVIRLSQALAGQNVLDKLMDMLLRTSMAQPRHEPGRRVRVGGADAWVEAEAAVSGEGVAVRVCDQPAGAELPQSVLQQVLQSCENVVLDDGAVGSPFAGD